MKKNPLYTFFTPNKSFFSSNYFTSYLGGLNLILGLVLTTMKVCKKWLLMQDGEKWVLSASKKTTQTISLPICRFLWSWKKYRKRELVSKGLVTNQWIPYARHCKPRLVHFFTQFPKTICVLWPLVLCMACIQEQLLIKNGLWWRAYGI